MVDYDSARIDSGVWTVVSVVVQVCFFPVLLVRNVLH